MNNFKKFNIVLCISLVFILLVAFTACGKSGEKDGPVIRVASKAWTEQLILGNMFIQLLEANGYPVEDRTGLGESPVIRAALHSGEVDLYWEYTGTTLMTLMGYEQVTEAEEAYKLVKEWDKNENNVVWLDYASANNTFTLMMRKEHAQELGIETISDLAAYINENSDAIGLATSLEFLERVDGIPGLEEKYGFKFNRDRVTTMEVGLTYGALRDNKVDVAMGFATDGRIPAFNFANLEDDNKFFPVYNPAPVIRQEILDAYPDLAEVLNKLPPLLDNDTLANLNKEVDVDQKEPEEVARQFLLDNELID
ncbi:MAG: glycine betaine ABC transporter substrate-binding protein [Acetivibrionales bacterium]|jgi:osmoprotectant transport system substrate-binding protein